MKRDSRKNSLTRGEELASHVIESSVAADTAPFGMRTISRAVDFASRIVRAPTLAATVLAQGVILRTLTSPSGFVDTMRHARRRPMPDGEPTSGMEGVLDRLRRKGFTVERDAEGNVILTRPDGTVMHPLESTYPGERQAVPTQAAGAVDNRELPLLRRRVAAWEDAARAALGLDATAKVDPESLPSEILRLRRELTRATAELRRGTEAELPAVGSPSVSIGEVLARWDFANGNPGSDDIRAMLLPSLGRLVNDLPTEPAT